MEQKSLKKRRRTEKWSKYNMRDRREDKAFFSRVGISYFAMALLVTVVQMVLSLIIGIVAPQLVYWPLTNWIVSLAPLYLLGIPVCAHLMRSLPAMQLYRTKMSAGRWFKILCICICVMYVGNIIGNIVCALISRSTGLDLSLGLDSLMSNGSPWFSFLFTVILAPIMEEFVFRKVMIDRTIVYGDKAAILLSGLMFGLFHGNFHQFFYAFGLGCILAYVYIRTGSLKYNIMLHMTVNFLGGFLSSLLLDRMDYTSWASGDPYAGIDLMFNHLGAILGLVLLEVCMIGMAIAGLVLLIKSMKKVELRSGERELPRNEMAGAMFGNPGIILFILMCVGLFVISMI